MQGALRSVQCNGDVDPRGDIDPLPAGLSKVQSLLAGMQNRLILGAKRGFSKSAWEGDIGCLPLGTRQPPEATVAESRGCLASEREDPAQQANVMPETLENGSIPRKRRNSILINRVQCVGMSRVSLSPLFGAMARIFRTETLG